MSVNVLELVPPYVQTELAGRHQTTDPHAMPLADYVAAVMELPGEPAQAYDEVLVDRVKLPRDAEKGGRYKQIFTANNSR
jgi:uncharacterized oxidoreductase